MDGLEDALRAEAAELRERAGPARLRPARDSSRALAEMRGASPGAAVGRLHELADPGVASIPGRSPVGLLRSTVARLLRAPAFARQGAFNESLIRVARRAWARTSRRSGDLMQRIAALERRRGVGGSGFDFDGFERRFGGRSGAATAALGRYVEFLEAGPDGRVVDFGCGNGAFLSVLRDAGVEAVGFDLRSAAVAEARARGLEAEARDGFAALAEAAPASLRGVVALQVVEHLDAHGVGRLIRLAASRLAPGGGLVLETVHPGQPYTLARAWSLDPSHRLLLHPELVARACRAQGFQVEAIEALSRPSIDMVPEGDSGLRRTFSQGQDFVVLARSSGG